jgi:hypothetical protein
MEMFPSDQKQDDEQEKLPLRALQTAPRSKFNEGCNIKMEQMWRILDRQFGYGTTSVIMQYWADEEPTPEDLFNNNSQSDHGLRKSLQSIEVYGQTPEEFNDAFFKRFSITSHPEATFECFLDDHKDEEMPDGRWLSCEFESPWAHPEARPDNG